MITRTRAARMAWSLWAVCLVLTLVALLFFGINGETRPASSFGPAIVDAVFTVCVLAFPTVGALIAARHPGNAIGWLFLVAGLGGGLGQSLLGYATYALLTRPGALPGGAWAGLLADMVWWPALAGGLVVTFVLFPNGRPLSRRWRWFFYAYAVHVTAYVTATAVNAGGLYYFPSVPNPLGVDSPNPVTQKIVDTAGPGFILLLGLGVLALGMRYRRVRGVERVQIKWLFYAAALWLCSIPVLIWLAESSVQLGGAGGVLIADLLFALVILTIPVAVGVAILRYRLYEIDVVINRTLVYGALTVTLGASYLAIVLLLQLLLSPMTQESGLAVAASTLAVAGMFRPARARIQAVVDRRFYRRKYDAARTLDAFGARLRDELDLEALAADLRDVVRDTMQPAHVSLWLRRAER